MELSDYRCATSTAAIPYLSATFSSILQHQATRTWINRLVHFVVCVLCSVVLCAQSQVGADIDGEAAGDLSGRSVAISGDGLTVAIGAPDNDDGGMDAGHVRVFTLTNGVWTQVGSDINGEAAGDESGGAVAISSDGLYVAIGATGNSGGGSFAGHVRVYFWNGTSWVLQIGDINGESSFDFSGTSVAISDNGSRVAIGATGNDGNGNVSGHVRVFQGGFTWSQVGGDIDGETGGDASGASVALSSDGTVVAIGSLVNDDGGNDAGHVRVYSLVSSSWIQRGNDIDGEAAGDGSGIVSLSADGTVLAIGAKNNSGNGSGAGHVRVYAWNGTSWVQRGSDIDGEAAGDNFGESVSLSDDGTKLAVGASANDGTDNFAGHVRIFSWNGSSWTQEGNDIDGEAGGDESGESVAMSGDGNFVIVGAGDNNGNGNLSGHARVFRFGCPDLSATTPNNPIIVNSTCTVFGGPPSGGSVSAPVNNCPAGASLRYSVDDGPFTSTVPTYNQSTAIKIETTCSCDNDTSMTSDTVSVMTVPGTCPICPELNAITPNLPAITNSACTEVDGSPEGGEVSPAVNNCPAGSMLLYSVDNGPFTSTVPTYNQNTAITIKTICSCDNDANVTSDTSSVSTAPNLSCPACPNLDELLFCQATQLGNDIDGEAAFDWFGISVATSDDGTIVAIGGEQNDGNGSGAGHVRVFFWNGANWVQRGQDIDGRSSGSRSGSSVALSSDGTTLAIGAKGQFGVDNGHVSVYSWNGSNWIKMGQDINGAAPGDNFGVSVSLSSDGLTLAAGALLNDASGENAGHVRVYFWNGANWVQRGGDINGEAAGDFSGKVSLSDDGNTLAIGASLNDGNGTDAGHVRVYFWNGASWEQKGGDINGEAAGDRSGFSVSLSSDGNRIAIGARLNNGIGGSNAGHVRVYFWNGQLWDNLGGDIDGEAPNDWFGYDVSLTSDGNVLAIGGIFNDNNGNNAGHVRLYSWNGTSWILFADDIDGEAEGDEFGSSVSLSADGTILAVGGSRNQESGSQAGHVRIYELSCTAPSLPIIVNSTCTTYQGSPNGGSITAPTSNCPTGSTLLYSVNDGPFTSTVPVYNQEMALKIKTVCSCDSLAGVTSDTSTVMTVPGAVCPDCPVMNGLTNCDTYQVYQVGADIDGEAAIDFSGNVSISSNGRVIAVGAISNNINSEGHVRIYTWNDTSWVQRGTDIDGKVSFERFGNSVALSASGNTVVIGALDGGNGNTGLVRIYAWNGVSWGQLGQDLNGEANGDEFGHSVAISNDGTIVAIGGRKNDGNGMMMDAGHVRVYSWNGISWNLLGGDIDGETADDESGYSVTLSGDGAILAVGARKNDDRADDAGHVRVYSWNGTNWVQRGSDIDGESIGDRSGSAVSLSDDGMIVAIGGIGNSGNGIVAGHVRVYSWNGTNWVQRGSDIDGESIGDRSGSAVSLSDDGNRVAIGGIGNSGNGFEAGHVRLYSWSGTNWVQIGQDIDGEAPGDQSGSHVALSGDGLTVIIGALNNSGNGELSGHARVFTLSCISSPAIVNSTCTVYQGTPDGGTINAALDLCPPGSTLMYSVDDGPFTSSIPAYNQTVPVKIETICNCNSDTNIYSDTVTVMTVPGSCPICPQDITVDNALLSPQNGDQTFQVSNVLQSDAMIEAPHMVTFRAGNAIEYSTPYAVNAGAKHEAQIGECQEAANKEVSDEGGN